MKTIKIDGVKIKPRLLIGTDPLTGEYVIAGGKDGNVKIDFTLLFMAIAKYNNKSYEELAQLTVLMADHISKNYPLEAVKVIGDEKN